MLDEIVREKRSQQKFELPLQGVSMKDPSQMALNMGYQVWADKTPKRQPNYKTGPGYFFYNPETEEIETRAL